MKRFILFLILPTLFLTAREHIQLPPETNFPKSKISEIPSVPTMSSLDIPKEHFFYVNPGFVFLPAEMREQSRTSAGEIAFGWRDLNSRHVFDRTIGIYGNKIYQGIYGRASYLYFPKGPSGIYFGGGLSLGCLNFGLLSEDEGGTIPYLSAPLFLGFQFKSNPSQQFIQLQISPFSLFYTPDFGIFGPWPLLPLAFAPTLSYGFGF
ncbi:MAG: hypothetical protein V4487_07190 [Chlamydiota bacterium]